MQLSLTSEMSVALCVYVDESKRSLKGRK